MIAGGIVSAVGFAVYATSGSFAQVIAGAALARVRSGAHLAGRNGLASPSRCTPQAPRFT